MEAIRHIPGSVHAPRFGGGAAPVRKHPPPSFGQDEDRYVKSDDDKGGSGNSLKRAAVGLKNGFLNAMDYFRPDNKKQILFDVLVGAGIGLVSALGTPVFAVTGPACVGLMVSISLIMRFASGLLDSPEEFAARRNQRLGK